MRMKIGDDNNDGQDGDRMHRHIHIPFTDREHMRHGTARHTLTHSRGDATHTRRMDGCCWGNVAASSPELRPTGVRKLDARRSRCLLAAAAAAARCYSLPPPLFVRFPDQLGMRRLVRVRVLRETYGISMAAYSNFPPYSREYTKRKKEWKEKQKKNQENVTEFSQASSNVQKHAQTQFFPIKAFINLSPQTLLFKNYLKLL